MIRNAPLSVSPRLMTKLRCVTISNCTYVFFGGMRSEFSCEHVQYVLVYPAAFGECSEREIVRVHFSQT